MFMTDLEYANVECCVLFFLKSGYGRLRIFFFCIRNRVFTKLSQGYDDEDFLKN